MFPRLDHDLTQQTEFISLAFFVGNSLQTDFRWGHSSPVRVIDFERGSFAALRLHTVSMEIWWDIKLI